MREGLHVSSPVVSYSLLRVLEKGGEINNTSTHCMYTVVCFHSEVCERQRIRVAKVAVFAFSLSIFLKIDYGRMNRGMCGWGRGEGVYISFHSYDTYGGL